MSPILKPRSTTAKPTTLAASNPGGTHPHSPTPGGGQSKSSNPSSQPLLPRISSPSASRGRCTPNPSPNPSLASMFTTLARTWPALPTCASRSRRNRHPVTLRRSAQCRRNHLHRKSPHREGDRSFTLSGKGPEDFQPLFTFHGFRYVELTGLKTKPPIAAINAVHHTDAPFTVDLHTGSPMINQLWSNILWGQRSNFVGVPTDCPQRDERLGWTADAQVFWRAASYNMDLSQFSKKFAGDIRDTQVGTAMYGIFAPGTSRQTPDSARAGAMPASSFRGPPGCSPETRAPSSRTGTAWRSTSLRSRPRILTIYGRKSRHPLWRLALARRSDEAAARRHCLLGL